jgi:hypothetical protein
VDEALMFQDDEDDEADDEEENGNTLEVDVERKKKVQVVH